MTGATVLTITEKRGEGEAVMRAGTENLTTGDAVGTSPSSAIGVEGDAVGFWASTATELPVERIWPGIKDPVMVVRDPTTPLLLSETTALATTFTTGTDWVTSPGGAGDMIRVEVIPFSTIAVSDPEIASEYVVPSTTMPEPPADSV